LPNSALTPVAAQNIKGRFLMKLTHIRSSVGPSGRQAMQHEKPLLAKPSIRLFFRAIVKTWTALMSGLLSVVLTGLGFLNMLQPYGKSLFFLAALVCCFYTAYLVWADERRELLKAEAYLSLPDLRIELQKAWRWSRGGGPFLLLKLAVTNHSATSATVAHFDCCVLGEGGRLKDSGWTTVKEMSSFLVHIAGTNTLEKLAAHTPDLAKILQATSLTRGQREQGYIEFYFKDLRYSDGTLKLETTLTDALGGIHTQEAEIPYSVTTWLE
jgi:hypothetical protein